MGYTQKKGQQAETLACEFLSDKGLKLITKNYHCRYGEIDLIMQQDQTIVFVEVRSRKSNSLVDSASSVNWSKQQKLQRTAENYLQKNNVHSSIPARFDVIAVTNNKDKSTQIDWIQNAFEG